MKYLKFIKLNGEIEIQETDFNYNIDEIIRVNNRHNLYKCVNVFNDEKGDTYHCFKQGKVIYNFG